MIRCLPVLRYRIRNTISIVLYTDIDNWIYLAHEGTVSTETYQKEFGDEGTEIYYPATPNARHLPKNASGRSVRFAPISIY